MSTVLFNITARGKHLAVAGSQECALYGVYLNGKPYQPKASDVRAALPYQWRAAYDRAGGWLWTNGTDHCSKMLYTTRGQYIGSIEADGYIYTPKEEQGT